MHIANVSGNIAGSLSLTNRPLRYQSRIQELSTVPNLLPQIQEQKAKSSNNMSEIFIGLFSSKQEHWKRLLQACDFKSNVERDNIDVSEHIKGICETSGKLFVESPLAEKTSCTYQMKDGTELSYLTFYEKDRIYCKKEGKEDLSFTIHNTFWQDFLSGKLNVDAFQEFINTSERKEILNGLKITEDGSFQEKETMKYVTYIYGPEFGANMIRTTEELWKWQKKQAEKIVRFQEGR